MNFELTEIAYANTPLRSLKTKRFYLRLLRSDVLIFAGTHFISIFQKLHLPIGWFFRSTIFRQFCGGETLEECARVVEKNASSGVKSLLDYSVEAGSGSAEPSGNLNEIIRSIHFASNNPYIDFAVFKPTGIADMSQLSILRQKSDSARAVFEQNCSLIAREAAKCDVSVLVDAEDYEFQDEVDAMAGKIMAELNYEKVVLYNTVQMYRTDRLEYVSDLIEKAKAGGFFAGIKLVRGAYLEKERLLAKKHGYESPVFNTKQETDDAYNAALHLILENISYVGLFAGTHNEHSNQLLATAMTEKGLAKNDKRVYFAQLYGMADHISNTLASQGYNVVKYVPYGKVSEVIPYMMRRIEENSSVSQQSKREIEMITSEIKRRKEFKYDN